VLQRGFERAQQQLLLVVEVVRDRPRRPAGLGGDVAQRGGTDSGPGDQSSGSVGDLRSPFISVDHLGH
jgi:hypothetical protein